MLIVFIAEEHRREVGVTQEWISVIHCQVGAGVGDSGRPGAVERRRPTWSLVGSGTAIREGA